MSKFTLGEKVTWSSQAGGYHTTKTGTVVRVIEAKESPIRVARSEFPCHRSMFDGMNIPGGAQTGYLVEVCNSKRGKSRLYLPYPSKLEKVKE